MGTRRPRAADRLAQSLSRGEAPADLRQLLVHGPLANPSFEQAETRKMARIEEAIALESELADEEPEVEEPVVEQTVVAQTVVAQEPIPDPIERERQAQVEARPRSGAIWVAAAAAAFLFGGLVAAIVMPPTPASALERGLASIPDPPRTSLSNEIELRGRAHAAELDAQIEDETIVLLEESKRHRGKHKRARRGSRRGGAPQVVELVGEAESARQAGARKDAIDLYERALTANPRASEAAAGLSIAYFDEGRFDLATAWAEHAVKNDFGNPEYHVLLGDAYYRNAALEDARRQWETAAKLGSDRARTRLAKLNAG